MSLDDKFKIQITPTFEFNKENLKKSLGNAIKEAGTNIDPIQLIGTLNIQETQNNINKSLSQLKLDKIKLDFDLNTNNLKNQMANLNLSNLNINENIKDNKITSPDNNELSSKSSNLISKSIKDLGDRQVITEVYRNNTLELEKHIETLNKEGQVIQSVKEEIRDYEKVQKTLYSELEKQEKKLSKLYSDRIKNTKNSNDQVINYDKLIEKQEQYINNLKEEIQARGLTDTKLGNITDDNKELNQLKAQQQAYKELEQQYKKLYDLKQKKDTSSGNITNLYAEEITKQKEIVTNIKKEIESRGLINKELQENINNLLRIQNLQDKNKELTRQTKIGNVVDIESAKKLSYDSSTSDLEEFGKSLNNDTEKFERITGLKNRIQDVNNAQKQFTVSMKSSKGYVTEYTYAIDKASGKVFELGNRTRRVNTTIAGFGAMFGEMAEKVFRWNLATTAVFKTMEFFQRGIKFIIELDTALTTVALVTGQTREEVEGLKQEYLDLAEATKKTVKEISNLNVELTRQGLSKEQASDRLDTILKLSAVGGTDVNSTLQIITSSVNALGEEAQRTADVLVYADNNSASSVEKIGIAMQKVASTAKASGVTIEQLAGQIATLIDVTQEAPETLGNSLKSMMARFSKVNELGGINEDINDVEKAFKQVGIAFKDSEGQIRPFYDLMTDMSKEWKNLDKNTQAMVATLSAGTMQQNRFLVLMQNWDRVQAMTSGLENNSEGSLDKGYKVWTESLQADINELKIAFEELWMTMIDEEQLSVIINLFTKIINVIDELAKHFNLALNVAIALFWKGIDRNTWKDFTAIVKKFGSAILLIPSGLKKAKDGIVNLTNSIKTNSKALISNIKNLKNKTTADKANEVSTRKLGISVTATTVKLKAMTTALQATKLGAIALSAVGTMGLSLILNGLFLAGQKIGKFVSESFPSLEKAKEKTEEMVESFQDLNSTHKSNIKELKEMSKEFERLNSIVGVNNDLTKLSAEEKEHYLEMCSKISEIAPEFISHWDSENNAMIKYGITIDDIIAKEKEYYKIKKLNLISEFQENGKDYKKIFKDVNNQIEKIKELKENFINTGTKYDLSYEVSEFNHGGIKRETYLEKNQKILNDPNSTSEEILKAEKNLIGLKNQIDELNAKEMVLKNSLSPIINSYKEILSFNLNDYYDELGDSVDNFNKSLITSATNDYLVKGLENGTLDIANVEETLNDCSVLAIRLSQISQDIKENLNDSTPNDLTDNVDDLKNFENQIISLGMSSEQATSFVNSLAFGIDELGIKSESSAGQVDLLAKSVSNNLQKINSLQELYKKSVNKNLSPTDIFNLNETDPDMFLEVLNKINEGKEIEVALQEVILENIEKINEATEEEINLQIQSNAESKKKLLEQKEQLENYLKTLEKKGDVESSTYRDLTEKLSVIDEELKTADEKTKKWGESLNAIKKINGELFSESQLDTANEQFKTSTNNISKYKEMLKTLNESGMTGDLYKDILLNYPDLIMFIDDEIALREMLNTLIAEEERLQKESYKLKLMYNEQFYKQFLANNRDLIKSLSATYNLDFQNFKTFAQAKEAVSRASANNIAKINQKMAQDIQAQYANINYAQAQQEIKNINEQMGKLDENRPKKLIELKPYLDEKIHLQESLKYLNGQLPFLKAEDTILNSAVDTIDLNKINAIGSSGGSSGGSSSSSSRKTMIDLIELEKEEYLKLNKALEKNNRLRDKNSKLIEYAYGSDKIDLLNKENQLLTERQQLDHQLANKYREEQAKLKKELEKVINMNTGDEGMDNFTAYMQKKEDEINSLIKKINATTNQSTVDSLTEQKDKLEKEVDKFAEKYQRYIEITFNTIPDLQDDYMDAVFEKFDNMVEMMSVQLDKYEREVSRLNVLKDLTITGRNDNTSELKRELEIHKEISNIYLNQLEITEKKVKETRDSVQVLQNKLNGIKDKNSSDYTNTYTSLITAKNMADEALKIYESNLQAYADSISSKVDIEIQLINKLRDTTKESLEDLRKEINEFTFDDFNNSLKEIELSLNKLDGIFIDNPSYSLDTSDTRKNMKDVEKTIQQIRKNTDKWKKSLEDVKKSNKSNKEIIEDIKVISEELIKVENQLNEAIVLKNQEIEKLRLEYQEIEDSLQNQIDLKNEELEKIQEEFAYEQKVNSLIEKRLKLLNALDDTSHMYVTGQGEVEWTYDKYAVDDLLKDIAEQDRQDKQDKIVEEMQEEINQMSENLEKTKEIHEKNLAVNEAQLAQMEQEKNYISNIIEDSFESLDENFDNMIDKYIDTINSQFEKNTGTLIDIYNLLKENVGSSNFNYKSIGNSSKEIVVGKNEETLDKIAKKYSTTVEKLLELNKGLIKNSILNFGQKIKIPSFDTGGYTGSFGDDGRLAILHQKELVLNRNDTKNLLNIIGLVRDIIGNTSNINIPNNKSSKNDTIINISHINLPNVQNPNQFINELQRFARGGMGSLS